MAKFDKKMLRREVRARIAMLDEAEKDERSVAIGREVERHLAVSGTMVVALFSPLGDEPQLWSLVRSLSQRMSVVLPRVEGDMMNFYSYDSCAMAKGAYGINEPQNGLPVDVCEIDAIVVPGVAFTMDGARMGRGKGYYDKYLSQSGCRALKIGVCYREQLVPDIPTEPHDVKMDTVIYR